jgi:hypothetical protein
VAQRIAVIGGGISGTFVSKYLVDLDLNCSLEALVIYDSSPTLGQLSSVTSTQETNETEWQSSRVATVEVDGHLVELGPSLVLAEFRLIRDMATTGNLRLQSAPRPSISLYNGNGDWAIHSQAVAVGDDDHAHKNAKANDWNLWWRCPTDYYKISRATKRVTDGMKQLHDMLQDNQHIGFDSPEQMYQTVRLWPLVMHSLENVADALQVTEQNEDNDMNSWRQFLYSFLFRNQGSLRQEFLTAMSLVYYHQDASRINGISGLLAWHYYVAIATATSESAESAAASLIVGGNAQLLATAFAQAQTNQQTNCRADNSNNNNNNNKPDTNPVVRHVQQRISTVVGSVQGFDLYAHDGTSLGQYDVVVLAAPLPTTQIEFLIQSPWDESVLQAMPLGGLVQHTHNSENEEDTTIPDSHHGHEVLPQRLPDILTRPYTQVVVTIVRRAILQTDYFSLDIDDHNNNAPSMIPQEIYMTAKGMEAEHNVTAIIQLSPKDGIDDDGNLGRLYKVYSSEPLSMDMLQTYFGPQAQVAFQKVWGGPHGGMVPDYQGQGLTTDFLLYDGATGLHGHTHAGALYFPNALEASFSNMETCAMGAKAVAKLIAKRMEWMAPQSEDSTRLGEEL